MANPVIGVGTMSVPDSWPQKVTATLLLPVEEFALKRATSNPATGLQSNAVVTLTSAEGKPLDDLMSGMLAAVSEVVSDCVVGDAEPFTFEDGATGRKSEITFQAGQIGVAQIHLLRIDGDNAAHIVLTTPAGRSADAAALLKVAKTYAPTSS